MRAEWSMRLPTLCDGPWGNARLPDHAGPTLGASAALATLHGIKMAF